MAEQRDLRTRLAALPGETVPRQPALSEAEVAALRKRLRGTRATGTPSPAVESLRFARDLPRATPRALPPLPGGAPVTLEAAIRGEIVSMGDWGNYFSRAVRVAEADGRRATVPQRLDRAFADPAHPCRARLCRLGAAADDVSLEHLLFLDLETTGLAHCPLFLIGALAWEDGVMMVRQFLARDYGEEAAAIAAFVAYAQTKRVLLTFNGKSFDAPYLRLRAINHRVPCPLCHLHIDLLHESRRIWRLGLPNCKLQTLEQYVCGHPPRLGDIPGALIPDAYHAFVRTGDARQIAQILQHNLLDLVTLAELLTHLPPLEG